MSPGPTYRKAEASGYLEYGLTPWLTVVVAPAVAHADGSPGVSGLTGSDNSAFGARLQLYAAPSRVLSLQVLVEPPLGGGSNGGTAADVRLLAGQSFEFGTWPAFIDVEPGVRFRGDPYPDEAKIDVTVGARPVPRMLLLLQDFNSIAITSTPMVARQVYSTLQASIVYDLSPRWSVQAGGFRVIAGRNALLGAGPIVAVWYRF